MLTGGLAGGLALGLPAVSGCATSAHVGALTAETATVRTTTTGFAHPGLLHSAADLARMRTKVQAKASPWLAGWNRLVANRHSAASWKPAPVSVVTRIAGGTVPGNNYQALYQDLHAAYQNAVRYRISGETSHADAASRILNAWSSTVTKITGDNDRYLAAGIYGYQFCNAAELMRGYQGFDLARFQDMMVRVFYPLPSSFLENHDGAYITTYPANWDLCSMAAVLAIGILCDEPSMANQAISYFKDGGGWGAIKHAVPYLHSGGLGQWMESGRDQDHTMLGLGEAGAICQMAWNQGVDLFGYDSNRLLAGAEYIAKYDLGHSVPYTPLTIHSGRPGGSSTYTTWATISPESRGENRPIWELLYNHYVKRRGLHATYTTQYASRVRPEGGGGNYGEDNAGYDQLGFGTLCYTL